MTSQPMILASAGNPLQNEMRSFQTRPPGGGARRCRAPTGQTHRHRSSDRYPLESLQEVFQAGPPWRAKGIVGYIVNFAGFDFLLEISRTANCARGKPAVDHGAPHDAGVGKMNRPGTDCANRHGRQTALLKITPRSLEGAQGAKRGRMLAAKQKRERRRLSRASSTIILNARKNLPARNPSNQLAHWYKCPRCRVQDHCRLLQAPARRAKSPPGPCRARAPGNGCAQEARGNNPEHGPPASASLYSLARNPSLMGLFLPVMRCKLKTSHPESPAPEKHPPCKKKARRGCEPFYLEEAVSKRKEGATPYRNSHTIPAPVPMEANPLKYLNKNLNYKKKIGTMFYTG